MILVTGASGQLSSAIVESLKAANVPVTRATRSPVVGGSDRLVDFDDPGTLDFAGIDTLVLVSAGYAEDDVVIARHERVVAAAERDGVQHLIYTSVATEGDHLGFALAHRWTERRIQGSEMRWTILRNGIYAELLGALMAPDGGIITAPLGHGGIAAVAREDLAEAAAVVAGNPDAHAGQVYDLVGSRAVTAEEIARHEDLRYQPESFEARRKTLNTSGLLPFQPSMLLSIYSSAANGFLATTGNDLEGLLARPLTDPVQVAGAMLQQH
ncbi:NAD(P)H-binding protein [Paeniglutamicibacter sp. ABSL32-1]|uniref:NAD(P)H-binding protein n=1 Tax=Paeniglutamicibacter quisquiliarum TaxID=2849498 RepID=UPI001C2D818E|nr:NAD(P)H-binding protein [Paeniglutamicibacter quisquiliarum]MBV1778532.1 NAD(P)H-binding protein [Paeniglutamicibacter quisquiliarum]